MKLDQKKRLAAKDSALENGIAEIIYQDIDKHGSNGRNSRCFSEKHHRNGILETSFLTGCGGPEQTSVGRNKCCNSDHIVSEKATIFWKDMQETVLGAKIGVILLDGGDTVTYVPDCSLDCSLDCPSTVSALLSELLLENPWKKNSICPIFVTAIFPHRRHLPVPSYNCFGREKMFNCHQSRRPARKTFNLDFGAIGYRKLAEHYNTTIILKREILDDMIFFISMPLFRPQQMTMPVVQCVIFFPETAERRDEGEIIDRFFEMARNAQSAAQISEKKPNSIFISMCMTRFGIWKDLRSGCN